MVISDISIQRPVLAFVISAMLVVFGVLGYEKLPVRELPKIDYPIVSISTTYPGASAEVVDNEITERIEGVINGIEGVKTIRSRSREGSSSVSVEFEIDRDIDAASNDVRDRVGRISDSLPEEAELPEISKVDADSNPIMWITLSSDRMNQLELTDFVRRYYLDALGTVPGVASVRIGGRRDFAMRVWLDRNAMAARRVTVQDIEASIRRENAELPAGRIESSQREFTVRTDTRLNRPEQFSSILVRQDGANWIRLGDVARVEVAARDDRGDFRINGGSAIGLGIIRQSTANTMEVSEGVRKLLGEFRQNLSPGMKLEVRQDDATFVSQSVYEVFHAIAVAIGLVVLVVWVFLRTFRATLIPVIAIPVSLVAAFGVMAALGFSINVLTLLAFVLAVGLVVDDAIIVVENISRRIEEGEPPLLAAYRGARQIGFAVIATTAVLIAVIAPLSMLPGDQGRLFREFAIALMASIAFSCIVALTLSPMLSSKLLRGHQEARGLFRLSEAFLDMLTRGYTALLRQALSARMLVMALMAGALVLTAVLGRTLPSELAPVEDRGVARISITGPEGASMDYTMQEVARVEGLLQPYLQSGEVDSILTIVNPGFGGSSGVNRAMVVFRTVPWAERVSDRTVPEMVNELRPKLSAMPGSRIVPILPSGLGGGASANQLQVVIGGNTFEELAEWRDALIARLQQYPGLTGFSADYDETKPQLYVTVDRNRAADLGVPVTTIGTTLETMLGEKLVTRYLDRGEEYDVVLRAEAQDRANPRDLSNIFVRSTTGTTTGQLIPLANLIQVRDVAGATELNRYNRLRSITITANLTEGAVMGDAIREVRQAAAEVLPAEARINFEGAARLQLEASSAIWFAFGMAMLVAFLVLAAQFENFRLPAMILGSVLPAGLGGILAISLTGMSLNTYTQIGLIMLIGLIAKNAIMIVEFANQLREEGHDLMDAVVEASRLRLRPILMTSIATVFGALPLALAHGAGAESRMAIGWVIVGGVTVGTALSLFITPVLYSMFARGVQPIGIIRRKIEEEERLHNAPPQVPAE
ncbi:efflux RND transporter permease subunit [Niveispirillum cyanobacteriorum]|uniref:Multidrug transporter AcrB n=1 Tax=Niveispirillum cyanobacteriorum TaxID=1612173 RepID=A0A2K9NC26_9PROT|nr:efflux RND transporter permease subunit [Niveispirillum cyanobacteriorum]AUN30639.1 multidrug transporter AcrB [Niveispirillum cyanobacteriorum]GGE52713.1 multidrug transporter [Niveispirillum cyanobacteriorum]